MKKLLPYYFKYIGLLIVFISIVYELIRTPLNFNKGIFSICVGLMLIIVSKNKVENKGGDPQVMDLIHEDLHKSFIQMV